MTIISSVTDRADGTGVDVVLGAGHTTADVTLEVATYTGAWTSLAFAATGTITDASTFAVSLAVGPFVLVAKAADGSMELQGIRVTDGSESIHHRCLRAIREHVIAMALPGMTVEADRHRIHSQPRYSVKELGGESSYVGVHYWPLPETRTQADNVRDNVIYPVQFVWIKPSGGSIAVEANWVKSRETLSKSFPACPLAGVTEINQVIVTPAVMYDRTASGLNLDLQSLIFECTTQQARQVV